MAKRYFEFNDEKSNKFWEIEQKGTELHVRWGKTGTDGQSQIKSFDSIEKAQKEHDKLVNEKTKKGYLEVKAGEPETTKIEEKFDNNLLEAVKTNDLEKVKSVLSGEFNINGKSENGSTILMWASKLGNVNIIKALLEAGANVSEVMSTGSSALAIAAKNNHAKIVKLLLEAGSKIDKSIFDLVVDRGYIDVLLEFGRFDSSKSKTSKEFCETFKFLCDTDEDKKILEALSYMVKGIEKRSDGGLNVKMENDIIECNSPFTGKPSSWVPKSYAAIASHYNGIMFESIGGGAIGFGGLNDSGEPDNDWGWDSSCLEEGGEERDDLADAIPAFGCGQNWLLFDPVNINGNGECSLGFVGHDSCTWETVESVNDLLYGSVLLKLMAQYFLGVDFEGVYN